MLKKKVKDQPKIALIGTGVYGLAMAMMANKNNQNIIMWTEDPKKYEKYKKDGITPSSRDSYIINYT